MSEPFISMRALAMIFWNYVECLHAKLYGRCKHGPSYYDPDKNVNNRAE